MSTPATGTSNVVTVGKAKPQATLQTVGVHQKIGPQPQIVKVSLNITLAIISILQYDNKIRDYDITNTNIFLTI